MPNNFWPENTKTDLYISTFCTTWSLNEVIELAKSHFGEDTDLDQLNIEAEYIHTSCIGYDLYCPGDYTRFIHISKK